MSFYSYTELNELGLKGFGTGVQISRKCSIYNPSNIQIGNNVRIDDFCILSAGKEPFVIEDYIHISAGVYIYGAGGFHIQSYSNVSAGTKIYSISDTFDGTCAVGPLMPFHTRKVVQSPVNIHKYVVVGCNSVLMPGVTIGEGVAIGANTFVNKSCEQWALYVGTPARYVKSRSQEMINLIYISM
jgi:galactoside O-acetyltransferase